MTKFRLPLLLSLALLALVLPAFGQKQLRGKMVTKTKTVPGSYNFWVYTPPEYEASGDTTAYPVVFFLHGSSLCGHNLNRVKRYGTLDALERGLRLPAVVIAPQNPGGAWKPDKLLKLLDWTLQNYRTDSTRVYVLGMSLGGYGTMDFAGTYPDRIAAALALCGGATIKHPERLGELPFWIIHGTANRAVPISASKRVVTAIQKSGHDDLLRFDWLSGVNHGRLARVFYMPRAYDWLFAHSLNDHPRVLDRQIKITKDNLTNAYRELRDLSSGK